MMGSTPPKAVDGVTLLLASWALRYFEQQLLVTLPPGVSTLLCITTVRDMSYEEAMHIVGYEVPPLGRLHCREVSFVQDPFFPRANPFRLVVRWNGLVLGAGDIFADVTLMSDRNDILMRAGVRVPPTGTALSDTDGAALFRHGSLPQPSPF